MINNVKSFPDSARGINKINKFNNKNRVRHQVWNLEEGGLWDPSGEGNKALFIRCGNISL